MVKLVLCLVVLTYLVVTSLIDVDAVCSQSARQAQSAAESKSVFSKSKDGSSARNLFSRGGPKPTTRRPPFFLGKPKFRPRRATQASKQVADRLVAEVKSKTARTFASHSYPTETIGSCCPQEDGYLVGWGQCGLYWPEAIPTVRCPNRNCYQGYWWNNRDGVCRPQNPRNHWVVLYCPYLGWPYLFVEQVTTYCNCGCTRC